MTKTSRNRKIIEMVGWKASSEEEEGLKVVLGVVATCGRDSI